MGKLKRDVCEAESGCFLWRGRGACTAGIAYPRHTGAGERGSPGKRTRGDCIVENDCAAPARVGNESFRRRGARWLYRGNAESRTRANRVTDSSGNRAERSHVVGAAKPGKPPARVPRGARREGAGGAQRRATRFAEGWNDSSPWRGTCEGKTALPPKAFPRNASCPPRGRGNERFLLSFNGRTRSARHRNILRGMLISEVLHPKQVYFICLHKELLHKTFHSDILHVAYPCLPARRKDTPSPTGGGVGGAAGGGTRPARVICNQISRYSLRGERKRKNYYR